MTHGGLDWCSAGLPLCLPLPLPALLLLLLLLPLLPAGVLA